MSESAIAQKFSRNTYTNKQIPLFAKKVRSAYLVAWKSPRTAFYHIWIESWDDEYVVVKHSGIKGRVLDKRAWPFTDLDEAAKLFEQRIKAKTNPNRKSPRKYTLVTQSLHG